MPAKDQAAYMREYRAKRKREASAVLDSALDARSDFHELRAENARLTGEVARLKRELAARPIPTGFHASPILRREDAAMREFRPVPKPGQKGK